MGSLGPGCGFSVWMSLFCVYCVNNVHTYVEFMDEDGVLGARAAGSACG